jgi:hypothetical protein
LSSLYSVDWWSPEGRRLPPEEDIVFGRYLVYRVEGMVTIGRRGMMKKLKGTTEYAITRGKPLVDKPLLEVIRCALLLIAIDIIQS